MTGQRGDHSSSFIIEMDTAAPQRSTNLVSSQCLNILDWVTSPRKYAKGQNFQYHLKAVNRFLSNINAPTEYHLAILVNSLDEECQLELYSHPEYNEDETDFAVVRELLVRIFDDKEAELSKLVRLMEMKQEPSEKLSQFLARIRVEAYKMLNNAGKEQKEKFILTSFMHGIRDKAIGRAVKTMDPESSEDALRLAKRAETKINKSNADILRVVEDKNACMEYSDRCGRCGKPGDLSEIKRQLQLLSQQVTFLTSRLKFQERQINVRGSNPQTYANAVKNGKNYPLQSKFQTAPGVNWNRRSQAMRCWNCDGEHTLRECTKKIICKTCHRTGHVSRFCESGDVVRYLHEESKVNDVDRNSEIELSSLRSATSVDSEEGLPLLTVELSDEDRISISTEKWQKQKTHRRKNKIQNQNKNIELDAWVDYINGESKRMPIMRKTGVMNDVLLSGGVQKRRYSPTVISNSRQEGAANKPLVLGKCGSVKVPILIDSGAALNVIDETFVKTLTPGQLIKIDRDKSVIRCANDETVKSKGKVTLMVEIGSFTEEMVFSIMPSLFPRVIIGLKQMKHSKMVVDPPMDALWIGREKIDFISKTDNLRKGNF